MSCRRSATRRIAQAAADLSQIQDATWDKRTRIAADAGAIAGPVARAAQDVPMQNLFYLRRLFDRLEDNAKEAMGVPARR